MKTISGQQEKEELYGEGESKIKMQCAMICGDK